MDFFEVEGYWKDDNQVFMGYVIASGYNFEEFGWSDDDIFLAGYGEKEIQDLIAAGKIHKKDL